LRLKKYNLFDSPGGFIKAIPRKIGPNLEFRQKLHTTLAEDEVMQKVYLQMCLAEPQIAFDTMFFTYNPRSGAGSRNWPFILRPQQIEVVKTTKRCIENGIDMKVEKSRDEGATELAMKYFTLLFLLDPESAFLVGSRKEELVDKTGSHSTLFAKFDYAIRTLPRWLFGKVNAAIERNHMHARNKINNSTIDGEATNENFGAGSRATAVLLDEFGRVVSKLAQSIKDSVHDVTDCVIFNSTHFYGASHPFAEVGRDGEAVTILLPWYVNPEKAAGLYTSPEMNVFVIKDIGYYRQLCPEIFNCIAENERVIYSKFERDCLSFPQEVQDKLVDIKFIADGCEAIPGDLRSPWHDIQEAKRSRRDLCQNVWMNPLGSSDAVFDPIVNNRIRTHYVRQPKYIGELVYNKKDGRIDNVKFNTGLPNGHFHWWGELDYESKPKERHNYVIGCDPSLGTGASNSVAAVVDVNTKELSGMFVSPNIYPEEFADMTASIAKWLGNTAYLIWENNGGHGINFGRRLLWHGVGSAYINRLEAARIRHRTNKYGWSNSRESKADLLGELQIALKEGIKEHPDHRSLRIYCEELVNELNRYIYFEDGTIDISERLDETSGARSRHGDRVIAAALCVLGMKEQPSAVFEQRQMKYGSFAHRRQMRKAQETKTGDLY